MLGFPLAKRPATHDYMSFTGYGTAVGVNRVDSNFSSWTVGQVGVEVLDD